MINYNITIYKPNGSLTREAHDLLKTLKREMNTWVNTNVYVFFGEPRETDRPYTLLYAPELPELKMMIYED